MSDSAQRKMAQALQEQQAHWNLFAGRAIESSTKLFELNLKIAKQSLEDTSESVRHLLKVKSPDEIFSLDQTLVQERLNQALEYANEIGAIASAFAYEISQAAQNQMAGNLEKVTQFADAAKPIAAPPLFPPQQGYEQWLEAGRKIAEAFGQNLNLTGQANGSQVNAAAPKAASTKARAK